MVNINYHNITHCDQNNGDGLRVTLWLSGCSHHCHGCQNEQTWNPDSGIEFDDDAKREVLDELSKDYISGITFSGGDPLNEHNLGCVLDLIKEIRLSFGDTKTIWMYTGYDFETLRDKFNFHQYSPFDSESDEWLTRWEILSYVDVLVDGRYEEDKRDITKKWAGSTNQRVIDCKKSINFNQVVLYCE